MSETIDAQPSWYQRHYHLLRRLHSLTGILPIGVFLIVHLLTNSSILWGKVGLRGEGAAGDLTRGGVEYFTKEVVWINREVPHLILIEIVLWLSIGFHSVLGVIYAMSGRPNSARYAYPDNWRYTLQRVSGYLGILFIFYHVATLRWGWTWLVPGGTQWDYRFAASTLAAALQGGTDGMRLSNGALFVSIGYFVGITMLVFHFANGLWTAAITWGLTVSAQAQRRWGFVCTAIGAGLMVMAWGALFRFATLPYQEARQTETAAQGAAAAPVDDRDTAAAPGKSLADGAAGNAGSQGLKRAR